MSFYTQSIYDTLRRARDIIANGWCQHQMAVGDSRCLWGSLLDAGDIGGAVSAAGVLASVLDFISTGQLVIWQDHPSRTQADVIGLFDRALVLVEAELAKSDPLEVEVPA